MADTTALKNRIRAAIKANDNQEITGPVLQQTLLDIVDELDLNPEFQEAINTEKNARQSSDEQLQQAISNEAQTRQSADTQLNSLITGIKNNIDNGYVYAGIATSSTNPVSGKVFYVAVHAGTYTSFDNTTVTEGITILKYNGTSWVKEQVLFTDDEPTIGSDNPVKSGGVASAIAINSVQMKFGENISLELIQDKIFNPNGSQATLPGVVSSTPIFFNKGTKISFNSDKLYSIQLRRWYKYNDSTTYTNLGKQNVPLIIDNSAYYSMILSGIGDETVTVNEIETAISVVYPGTNRDIDSSEEKYNRFKHQVITSLSNYNFNTDWNFNKYDPAYIFVPVYAGGRCVIRTAGVLQFAVEIHELDGTVHGVAGWNTNIATKIEYNGLLKLRIRLSNLGNVPQNLKQLIQSDVEYLYIDSYSDDIILPCDENNKRIDIEKTNSAILGLLPDKETLLTPIFEGYRTDEHGSLIYDGVHTTSLPIYLGKGTVITLASPMTLYIRGWRDSVQPSNLVVSGYKTPTYITEFSGWFAISYGYSTGIAPTKTEVLNAATITPKNIHDYIDESVDLYARQYISEISANDATLSTDGKVAIFEFPFAKGCHAYIRFTDGDTLDELYMLYEKNGVVVGDLATWETSGWTTGSMGLYAISDCDKLKIRFRRWNDDHTAVKTLDSAEITGIINNILDLHIVKMGYLSPKEYNENQLLQQISNQISHDNIISVCHQGMLHYSKAGGYKEAAKLGFDFGECDVTWTSDNKLVCCHDASFVDGTTGETVIIRENTLAELKTHNYYGGTIASFEEILSECKLYGLKLVFDQVDVTKATAALPIIKKYGMGDRIAFLVAAYDSATRMVSIADELSALYPEATIIFALHLSALVDTYANFVTAINNYQTNKNVAAFFWDYELTVSELIEKTNDFNTNVDIAIGTTDKVSRALSVMPYVKYLYSNVYSYKMILDITSIQLT